MHYILNRMMELRSTQIRRLQEDPQLTVGDVTSVNLTRTNGGVQSNVIPSQLMICFDIRLALDIDHEEFEAKVGGNASPPSLCILDRYLFGQFPQISCIAGVKRLAAAYVLNTSRRGRGWRPPTWMTTMLIGWLSGRP